MLGSVKFVLLFEGSLTLQRKQEQQQNAKTNLTEKKARLCLFLRVGVLFLASGGQKETGGGPSLVWTLHALQQYTGAPSKSMKI